MTSPEQPAAGEPDPSKPINQEIRHSQVSARIPSHIGHGVFSTGAIVLQGQDEFILDFLQIMGHPHQVAARVVLSANMMERFIAALKENLQNYQKQFGAPPALPTPPPGTKQPSIEEIYEQLKFPDDLLSGHYANAVMIGHTAAEFWFDFITNFYPRSAVSARIFHSAPQVPRFLDTLTQSYQQFRQRQAGGQPPSAPPESPTS